MGTEIRLDASESTFFTRQNEHIEQRLYETRFPDNKARQFVPTIPGMPDSAPVYTWRKFTKVGQAKTIRDGAGDLPRADAYGEESSQVVNTIGASYGWNLFEIKEAARTNTPLQQMKADAARFAIEQKIDALLATGETFNGTDYWCRGLLNQQNTTTFTPNDKSKGGKTWANASADEIVADVGGAVQELISALKGIAPYDKFDFIVPLEQYQLCAHKRMGDGSDMTVLKYIQTNLPGVRSFDSWYRCDGAGAGNTDRMVAYYKDVQVVGGLVPMEFTVLPYQQRGMNFEVDCVARVGGCVSPLPIAICYTDGI